MSVEIITEDCRTALKELPAESVQCCVTSPPYWGLRDYAACSCSVKRHASKSMQTWDGANRNGHSGPAIPMYSRCRKEPDPDCSLCRGTGRIESVSGLQIGLEESPQAYVESMRQVFSEVWRVLRDDGTLWLNLGDSYARNPAKGEKFRNGKNHRYTAIAGANPDKLCGPEIPRGLKPKDLCGIPWHVAFALQDDGWYLRSDVIWAKPNCMPESVTDRPTRSHEYIFLLTKSERYYYNHEAIKEPPSPELLREISEGYNGTATKDFSAGMAQDASATKSRIINGYRQRIEKQRGHIRRHDGFIDRWDNLSREEQMACGSNKRDVWTVAPANYPEAHFATFPPDLIKPCILAGTKPGDVVLDPFGGSGTTGMVAVELGRKAILIELNPDYAKLSEERCNVTPGLALA